MRIEEIERRIAEAKYKRDTYQELLHFWEHKLEIAMQSEIKETGFDHELLITMVNEVLSGFYDQELNIKDKSRRKELVFGRSWYCNYVRSNYVVTLETIGKTIDRNHATVLNSINQHNDLMRSNDYEYHKLTQQLENYIK